MSLKEIILFRLPQQLQLKVLGRFQKNVKFNVYKISVNQNFKVNEYKSNQIKQNLTNSTGFFNYSFFDCSVDISKPINWLKDYKNGIESTKKYYGNINRQNFDFIGDVKYVCEPSRFHFLPFLALKDVFEKSKADSNLIFNILRDWNNQNPYLQTIHWTSGIEVGIRSVNLVYTHLVLKSAGILSPEVDKLIKEIILRNYHFLKNHLSLYSSANNHLVAELTGLVVISCYFNSVEINKNRKKWRSKLFKEIFNQINEDGVNMELSTHYHAEVADHFLNALIFIKNSGEKVPSETEKHYFKMFNFIEHVEYFGTKTIYGDNDEGFLIFPYMEKKFSLYVSLLYSASFLSSKEYSVEHSGKIDLRNYLIFGDSFLGTKINPKPHNDFIFKDSGYAFFYDNNNRVKVSFDFGTIGDKISAAHGHSDVFHFTLDISGIPFLIDSGTFQYHKKDNFWREYFRGISAHNTISVSGKDHAIMASRMSWINQPRTKILDQYISNEMSFVEAETNAFEEEGVIHRRKLILEKNKKLTIEDSLILKDRTNKKKKIDFYLNFDGDKIIQKNKNEIVVESHVNGSFIVLRSLLFKKAVIINAGENGALGWRSNKFNQLAKGFTVVVSKNLVENEKYITEIFY